MELVQSDGVNLICIEEGIDSSQTSGQLLISVLSAVAEIERENIIEQTMNGRREKGFHCRSARGTEGRKSFHSEQRTVGRDRKKAGKPGTDHALSEQKRLCRFCVLQILRPCDEMSPLRRVLK